MGRKTLWRLWQTRWYAIILRQHDGLRGTWRRSPGQFLQVFFKAIQWRESRYAKHIVLLWGTRGELDCRILGRRNETYHEAMSISQFLDKSLSGWRLANALSIAPWLDSWPVDSLNVVMVDGAFLSGFLRVVEALVSGGKKINIRTLIRTPRGDFKPFHMKRPPSPIFLPVVLT